MPASGVVKVGARAEKTQLTLTVPWAAPVGTAVFRHGDAVWIVFDARAKLDLSALPKSFGGINGVQWAQGPDFTVLRVGAADSVAASADSDGPTWRFTFGGEPQPPPEGEPKIDRDDQTGPASLTANSSAIWVGWRWIAAVKAPESTRRSSSATPRMPPTKLTRLVSIPIVGSTQGSKERSYGARWESVLHQRRRANARHAPADAPRL